MATEKHLVLDPTPPVVYLIADGTSFVLGLVRWPGSCSHEA